MLPSAEHSTFQKNAESLLHVAARVLPVHTGQYATALKKDSLVEPLTGHWIYESDVGLKAKTEKELHHRKVVFDTAKTARDNAEKDMNLFAVDTNYDRVATSVLPRFLLSPEPRTETSSIIFLIPGFANQIICVYY